MGDDSFLQIVVVHVSSDTQTTPIAFGSERATQRGLRRAFGRRDMDSGQAAAVPGSGASADVPGDVELVTLS